MADWDDSPEPLSHADFEAVLHFAPSVRKGVRQPADAKGWATVEAGEAADCGDGLPREGGAP